MKFFDRFRRKPAAPSTTREKVREEPGPLTAHEAWALVWPRVLKLEKHPRLTLVSSGLDLSGEGRSFTWEFGFDLPRRGRHALFTVEPSGEGEDIDRDAIVIVQRSSPLLAGESERPALPKTFRDSPEVVADFAEQGVDFVAGPSDLKLEGRVLPSGEAVWVTYDWDNERTTRFARE